MKKNSVSFRAALLLVLATQNIQADTLEQNYSIQQKLGRGLANISFGFMELPANLNRETEAHGGLGFPLGFVIGTGMMVERELVGVYELISAPIPLPEGYRPILQPEYPWNYFK
jgi:putative exosortase-associated protein (TIGR04073 family)